MIKYKSYMELRVIYVYSYTDKWLILYGGFRGILKLVSHDTLRKLYFHFLSDLMGYDRGVSFPIDFEPNGFPFGSKSKGKLSPRSYPIQYERKTIYSFLSAWLPTWWHPSRLLTFRFQNLTYTIIHHCDFCSFDVHEFG